MENQKARDTGAGIKAPAGNCADRHCPFHGTMPVHGRMFQGRVIGTDFNKTARVEWGRSQYIPKYERYQLKRTRVKAHNPDCIAAKTGDIVVIMECRPISKTKNFVIMEKKEK